MDQQQVTRERLRRDIAYHVAELRKSQRRRLNRLRDDLRYSPLPADRLHLIFSRTIQEWDTAFARLEEKLTAQGERLLASGLDYTTMHTELTRLATTTLHNLLDTDLTAGTAAYCSPLDRILHVTTRIWNAIALVAGIASVVFAGLGALSVTAAGTIIIACVAVRVALELLSTRRENESCDRVTTLDEHLNHVTTQFYAELDHLPNALASAFEQQRDAA